MTDTIVAIASGPGRSPLAIVRISGPAARDLLARVLESPPAAAGAHLARFKASPLRGLPCRLLRFNAPRSYSGQDAAELVLPGNPHLLDRVVGLLLAHPNAREALPGEFSARAYLHGKLSLAQAEGVAAAIGARTADELAAARDLLDSERGAPFRALADELAALLALVEAGIDFADQEDVVPIAPADLLRRLGDLVARMTALLGTARGAESPDWRPAVALVGRPNAGKSTLFNALLGRRRAVTSPIPGSTRDVLCEELPLPGSLLTAALMDLAGLDDAAPVHALAAAARAAALAAARRADVVLWCDPTGRFDPAELPALAQDAAIIRLRPKADQAQPAAPSASAHPVLQVCALDGRGLDALRSAIADSAWSGGRSLAGGAHLLPRHRRALLAALQGASAAARLVEHAQGGRALPNPELIAGRLRQALDAAGELVGRVHPDDIVGRIFATFCIGK